MRIAIASDHAGLTLRRVVIDHLGSIGDIEVLDLGPDLDPNGTESVDYPDYAVQVAHAVVGSDARFGVLICGSGVGMSMAANKIRGVRAALCTDAFTARASRAHNDANILCIGERVVGQGLALSIVDAFFSTEFSGARHKRRLDKMMALEKEIPS